MSAHLDLEDVAHGQPKAQEELRELYARLDVAERMAQALREALGWAPNSAAVQKTARDVLAEWEALR